VNVLFALAWPNPQFHRAATLRLESGADRWTTCALTQIELHPAFFERRRRFDAEKSGPSGAVAR